MSDDTHDGSADPTRQVRAPRRASAEPKAVASAPQHSAADFDERYVKRDVLGVGGMGEVELVHDRCLGRDVALKRIRSFEGEAAERFERHFLKEVARQARLEHPCIVPVYDIGRDPEGRSYFTMKRVSGRTLSEVLAKRAEGDASTLREFPLHRVLGILSQVASTVEYAHSRGLLHRDLKPSNIMVGSFGEAYVLDWGIAGTGTLSGDLGASDPGHTTATLAAGSLMYAAPEQLAGDGAPLGPPADVWSLGSILFEVLTGKRLRDTSKAEIVPAQRLPSERHPELDVAPELDAICARALMPEPGARYPDAAGFVRDLEHFVHGERDAELRRTLADAHARSAAREALRARELEGEAALEARRGALREVGRALGLAPGHGRAMRALGDLIRDPPRFVPDEVRDYVALSQRETLRRGMAWASVISLFGLIGTLGFLATAPIRMPRVAVAAVLANCAVMAIAFFGSRPGRGRRPETYLGIVGAATNLALLSRVAGPLVWVPVLFVALAFVVAATHRKGDRVVFGCIVAAGFLAPVVLELVGVLPESYAFAGGRLIVEPQLVAFSRIPALAGLVFVVLFAAAGALIVGRTRDLLTEQETARAVTSWQLGQLVEGEAQASGLEVGTKDTKTIW